MSTVHLVYPHGPRISCPDAIGRNLGQRLARHYNVIYYDWEEARTIRPAPGDVLLGHPHPAPWTCFRRSLSQPGWRRKIILAPYNHGDNVQVSFMDSFLERCDLYLAITGNYWFRSIESSLYAHWRPKMVHVDLAVDRGDFPVLKWAFNMPGQRRFVYIGHSGWTKNTDYLCAIASRLPQGTLSWIGAGAPLRGMVSLGFQDFSTERGQEQAAQHDFLLTVGKSDANPATILEAMAWGLIPVCTPQSGYVDYAGIINVPLGDADQAAEILRRLQQMPEVELREKQALNWQALEAHFNWERFTQQVIQAIESDARPALGPVSRQRRLQIKWAALISPHSPWRPLNLARSLYGAMRRARDGEGLQVPPQSRG